MLELLQSCRIRVRLKANRFRTPFPALVESDLGVNCINLGIPNAGIDVFLNDSFPMAAADNAEATVIQVLGAHNMSNRFYSVHPRRNDRFLSASTLLSTIYSEVDFSEIHFTKHLLSHLHAVSPERFAAVRSELQSAWVARMRLFLNRISGKTVLLWVAGHAPMTAAECHRAPLVLQDPLFVTREMLDEVATCATEIVEVVASAPALATDGMIFDPMEASAASELPGPKIHGEVAAALGKVLHRMIG